MKKKSWDYNKIICLKDVTVYGTGYFSRYFEWMGEAREIYYTNVKDFQKLGASGVILVTRKAWCDYTDIIRAFDSIRISIYNSNFKRISFQMNFDMFNMTTGKLAGRGGQVLTFLDAQRKLIKIPENILEWVLQHQ